MIVAWFVGITKRNFTAEMNLHILEEFVRNNLICVRINGKVVTNNSYSERNRAVCIRIIYITSLNILPKHKKAAE
ncbi:hypothetical protein [Bacillus sp. LL01]|uniref:hypothetical protein n=1 Tax=Bacillus sp. LL01 TaxID=1665556 RepID=UPI0018E2D648|nr:hypothetical protein [Bacillus sp. LL01]